MMGDEAPRRRDAPLAPLNYDGWSISDFDQHIAALQAEMARAEAAWAARQASLSAAAGFFRPPG